jgi:hypothetical protein
MVLNNDMSVNTKYILKTLDGRTDFLSLQEWATTLSEDEQKKFDAAQLRQTAHTQRAIDQGVLTVVPVPPDWHPTNQEVSPKFIWKDEETARKGKPADRTWLMFWERYISENNLSFQIAPDE